MSNCILMIITKVSTPTVFPSNWNSPRCSVKKNWHISYYVYTDAGRKKKIIKNMNHLKTWQERHEATKELLDAEIKRVNSADRDELLVKQPTSYVVAYPNLQVALLAMVEKKRKHCDQRHCNNLETKAKRFYEVGKKLKLPMTIQTLTRQQCLSILDAMYTQYKTFNDKTYNNYVKDLRALFNELVYWEHTKDNYFNLIKKIPVVKQLKKIATLEQRKAIDKLLFEKNYALWRFMHIFFHSGAREAELCRMKTTDIHLKDRYFVITIKKGKSRRQEVKAILPAAYRHWGEVVMENELYPFGKDLLPGPVPMDPLKIGVLWKRLVKKHLGYKEIDFYSLKHLHTDMLAQTEGIDTAQAMDDHLNKETTMIYAVGEKSRKLSKLKQSHIKFV